MSREEVNFSRLKKREEFSSFEEFDNYFKEYQDHAKVLFVTGNVAKTLETIMKKDPEYNNANLECRYSEFKYECKGGKIRHKTTSKDLRIVR